MFESCSHLPAGLTWFEFMVRHSFDRNSQEFVTKGAQAVDAPCARSTRELRTAACALCFMEEQFGIGPEHSFDQLFLVVLEYDLNDLVFRISSNSTSLPGFSSQWPHCHN